MIRAAIVTALVLLPPAAVAATITVPSDQPTIQQALNLATVGDTVRVEAGTYSGTGNRDLDFGGKDLVLLGAGIGESIIDCEGSASAPHRAFDFHSGETAASLVEGFTIRNGYSANWGGGINCRGASPTIRDCSVEECYATTFGGGIAVWNGGDPLIDGCSISENVAADKGGGIAVTGAHAVVQGSSITGNNAALWGGGIFVDLDSVAVHGTIAAGNSAASGGGIYLRGAAMELADSRISGNSSSASGGGVTADLTCQLDIQRAIVSGNTSNNGGGLRLSTTTTGSIRASTIAGNLASSAGGGIHLRRSLQLDRTIFADNCAPDGPAVFADNESDDPVSFACCAIDPTEIGGSGPVGFWNDIVVTEDPGFCQPISCLEAPTSDGEFSLRSDSPCLPQNNLCGELIGALGQGCEPAALPDLLPGAAGVWAYPSPLGASDVLWLRLGSADRTAELFDAAGRSLWRLDHSASSREREVSVSLNGLVPSAGVYFLRVAGHDGHRTAQIVVRR
ncbi:MAG: right-handed parallel beta-helix repeat-containing protein [Candidatus Eisenbacteria bacterium]